MNEFIKAQGNIDKAFNRIMEIHAEYQPVGVSAAHLEDIRAAFLHQLKTLDAQDQIETGAARPVADNGLPYGNPINPMPSMPSSGQPVTQDDGIVPAEGTDSEISVKAKAA